MVLYLSHDGACTDSFENFREIIFKGALSNAITLNPPLFSLVNTFKIQNQENANKQQETVNVKASQFCKML